MTRSPSAKASRASYRVDRAGSVELAKAYGLADRAHEVANTVDTQFGIASGTKGMTALAVVSLIEDGTLELSTTARSALGRDLPLIGDDVTIEHLLSHRSGIGDYLDEETEDDFEQYLMPIPVHALATTEQYLAVLDGHDTKFAPGERFAYCNGGYVVLALIAERTSGVPFPDLVHQRVCEPAGMPDTAFLRSDELPGRAAIGYLADRRHRGPTCSTSPFGVPEMAASTPPSRTSPALWRAFFAGRIVASEWVAEMIGAHTDEPRTVGRYGLGFWLHESANGVELRGSDAGVSFRSVHDPSAQLTHTVISNTTDGAWSIARFLDQEFSRA